MSYSLPASMRVFERGWLSANNILFLEGEGATLVDSGYHSHAAQTLALLRQGLDGRQLRRLFITHAHSDHMGGNAALQAEYGCSITIPAGAATAVAGWDADALMLSPLGQSAPAFTYDSLIAAGAEVEMGGLTWQALAAPGHDMDALAYYCPEKRLLISGDALWENGFGLIFPELQGLDGGLAGARATLEQFGRLAIDCVIPGHGAPFTDVGPALERAGRRLDDLSQNAERFAWHACKVLVAFVLQERQRLPSREFADFVRGISMVGRINQRFLGQEENALVRRLFDDLQRSGALRREGEFLLAR